jgi:hypothetical protein
MSDHPTWRLPATRPVAGQRDVTYIEADEALWRDYLRDRLASLTTVQLEERVADLEQTAP